MARLLYDLAGAEDDRRFSPYCWRSKMALVHKGLAFESVPWRFTETDALTFSGQGKVPILVDGDRCVFDSWTIATYLEDAYGDRPSLFGGSTGRAMTAFFNNWVDGVVQPALFWIIVHDIFTHLAEKDRDYFRTSREARLGMTLEQTIENRDVKLAAFRAVLQPVRMTLRKQPFIGGDQPTYPDYILFGAFQFARAVSAVPLLEPGDPVAAWRERLLDAHGGLARQAKGYPG